MALRVRAVETKTRLGGPDVIAADRAAPWRHDLPVEQHAVLLRRVERGEVRRRGPALGTEHGVLNYAGLGGSGGRSGAR